MVEPLIRPQVNRYSHVAHVRRLVAWFKLRDGPTAALPTGLAPHMRFGPNRLTLAELIRRSDPSARSCVLCGRPELVEAAAQWAFVQAATIGDDRYIPFWLAADDPRPVLEQMADVKLWNVDRLALFVSVEGAGARGESVAEIVQRGAAVAHRYHGRCVVLGADAGVCVDLDSAEVCNLLDWEADEAVEVVRTLYRGCSSDLVAAETTRMAGAVGLIADGGPVPPRVVRAVIEAGRGSPTEEEAVIAGFTELGLSAVEVAALPDGPRRWAERYTRRGQELSPRELPGRNPTPARAAAGWSFDRLLVVALVFGMMGAQAIDRACGAALASCVPGGEVIRYVLPIVLATLTATALTLILIVAGWVGLGWFGRRPVTLYAGADRALIHRAGGAEGRSLAWQVYDGENWYADPIAGPPSQVPGERLAQAAGADNWVAVSPTRIVIGFPWNEIVEVDPTVQQSMLWWLGWRFRAVRAAVVRTFPGLVDPGWKLLGRLADGKLLVQWVGRATETKRPTTEPLIGRTMALPPGWPPDRPPEDIRCLEWWQHAQVYAVLLRDGRLQVWRSGGSPVPITSGGSPL